MHLLASDTEETDRVRADSNVSSPPTTAVDDDHDDNRNEEYEKQAEEMLDEIWRIYNDDESWYEESKSKDGCDIVRSKQFPRWGKIFRLVVRKAELDYECIRREVFRALSRDRVMTLFRCYSNGKKIFQSGVRRSMIVEFA